MEAWRPALGRFGTPARVLADVTLPRRCVCCEELGTGLCGRCAARLLAPPESRLPAGVDDLVAVASYEGLAREVVLALKRANRRDAVDDLGAALAAAVGVTLAADAGGIPPGLVTWAPTTEARRRRRGFDQAELLARAVAAHGVWPCGSSLVRLAPAQMGHGGFERLHGPRFEPRARFALGRRRGGVPSVVVLVDDVMTTGATLAAAAAALRSAGAESVLAAVIAVA